MLPSGVDPIFPNKHLAGHDVFGRPVYDMAATGFRVWEPPEPGVVLIADECVELTDDDWAHILKRMSEALYGKE